MYSLNFRYASIFPHSQFLFCSIIEEFGMKKDMVSAMRVFEVSKEKSGGFNMFACRSIIDVCGICGDFVKSRRIFKVLIWMPFSTMVDTDFLSYELSSIRIFFLMSSVCVHLWWEWMFCRGEMVSYRENLSQQEVNSRKGS